MTIGESLEPSGTASIDQDTQDRIHALWDELADFDVAHAEHARSHLLRSICELIDAQNATWIGAVRLGSTKLSASGQPDPIRGWRPRAIRPLHPSSRFEKLTKEQAELLEAGCVDETVIANVAGAGHFRVNLVSELVSPAWYEGDYYRAFYRGAGYGDVIWAGVPVNADAECYFGFNRGLDKPPFGVGEKMIVAAALHGLRWFHRQQLLSEGLSIASAPLTSLERRVLHGLLQGLSDKKIATEQKLGENTVREYVKRIFRKYGVGSRTALMALWLGKSPSP